MSNYRDFIPGPGSVGRFFKSFIVMFWIAVIFCFVVVLPIHIYFGGKAQAKIKSLCEYHEGISLQAQDHLVCNDGVVYILFHGKLTDSDCIVNGKIDTDIGRDDLDCGNLGD